MGCGDGRDSIVRTRPKRHSADGYRWRIGGRAKLSRRAKNHERGQRIALYGSLISPYLILTARHCIAGTLNRADEGGIRGYSTFGKTIRPSQVTITTAYAFKKPGAVFHPVKEIIVPKGNRWCSGDIALSLVLEEPILSLEVAPLVPRIESPVFVDEPYSVVGYGKIGHDKDSRSEHVGAEPVYP